MSEKNMAGASVCPEGNSRPTARQLRAVAPSLQTAIYEFLMYICTAFLSSYVSAGGFAFFRDLETRQALKD